MSKRKNDRTTLKRGRDKRRQRADKVYSPPQPATPQYDSRPFFRSFDDYVKAHPEAERFRRWLTANNREPLILPAIDIMHGGMPGGYVWAYTFTWQGDHVVWINDNDDGRWSKHCQSREEAVRELELLTQLIPFTTHDLCASFGYHSEV